MSDDQGFHEVQLSGKQLVFLFMSAVVVMVVVFLLGVNVGRGVRGAVGDTEVSAQADVSTTKVPDDAAVAGAEPAKPAQPELSYHDMLLGAKPSDDKAGGDKTPPSVAPPPVEEAPPPTPPTKPTPTPSAPTPTPTPTPAALAQAPTPAPKSSGTDWFLQTGAYSTQAVADGQVAQLKQLNVPAFVLPPDAKLKSFRVRIGPYSDRAQAEQVKSRIARQGFQSLITR